MAYDHLFFTIIQSNFQYALLTIILGRETKTFFF